MHNPEAIYNVVSGTGSNLLALQCLNAFVRTHRQLRRSPGADPEIYFPSDQHERRLTSLHGEINDMIYGSHEAPDAKCTLKVAAQADAWSTKFFMHALSALAALPP